MDARLYRSVNYIIVEVEKGKATHLADVINQQSFVEVIEVRLPAQMGIGKVICYELVKDAMNQLKNFLAEIDL